MDWNSTFVFTLVCTKGAVVGWDYFYGFQGQETLENAVLNFGIVNFGMHPPDHHTLWA